MEEALREPLQSLPLPVHLIVSGRADAARLACDQRSGPPWPGAGAEAMTPRDERPPFTHLLNVLAHLAGMELDPRLLALQPYAVEARYEEGPSYPFPRP